MKKAELTTQQIVLIIVLILSFSVILFLLFRLNLNEVSEKEICHQSVVLKSSPQGKLGSIDCKTTYLCISNGEACSNFLPSKTIKLEGEKETKDEVMLSIADEMADCWWMFGEGQLEYANNLLDYSCGICSVIKLDDVLTGSLDITYGDLYDFLATENKSDSQTYLQYLYGVNTVELFQDLSQMRKINFEERITSSDRISILTGDKYSGNPLYVYALDSSKVSSELPCGEIITKV